MRKYLIFVLVVFAAISCQKDLDELEKYQPPDWLKGKLYTQIASQDELTVFAEALVRTGMDSIINTSGLFTVFAPDNGAFDIYFESHPEFAGDIENIPLDQLKGIVDFHIVQNAWSKQQIASVNLDGWIDEDDDKITQRAYKKETLFKSNNKEYPIAFDEDEGVKILDGDSGGASRIVYTASRKYVPVFFREYFETYDISPSDYEFFFGRPYTGGLYFAGAEVVNEEEIPAENGYVYLVDRVVEPIPNVEEVLERTESEHSYMDFLRLIHTFPEFTANLDATYQQSGASEGLQVDTLYNLNYPELAFNIQSEITDPTSSRSIASIQYHNGMLAPSDAAFAQFVEDYISGPNQWGRLENLPRSIKTIIVNSYMARNIIYKSDLDLGFVNAENDEVQIAEADIDERIFASNATFFGLNKAIIPRAFSSVTAPVYLRRGYFTFLTAIEETNILDALKKSGQEYTFFIIPDIGTGILADSSIILGEKRNEIVFTGFDYSLEDEVNISKNDLRKKILNHVGTSLPEGFADIEFVKNLAGNYLVFDNVNNIVRGTAPTTYGLNGDSLVDVVPALLDEQTDNGKTFRINTWLSFSKNPMSAQIVSVNPNFMYLMEDAGLADRLIGDEFELSFLNPGVSYTAFIPSFTALNNYNTDTLSGPELEQFIRNHFVPNYLLFTDGKVSSGKFATLNSGTSSALEIRSIPDKITLLDRLGAELSVIEPGQVNTNLTTTTSIGNDDSNSRWNFVTNGVVHMIDTVLISDQIY